MMDKKPQPQRTLGERVYYFNYYAYTPEIIGANVTGMLVNGVGEVEYFLSSTGDRKRDDDLYSTPEEVRNFIVERERKESDDLIARFLLAYDKCLAENG